MTGSRLLPIFLGLVCLAVTAVACHQLSIPNCRGGGQPLTHGVCGTASYWVHGPQGWTKTPALP